ncbi:MAG: bifunctional (p)ppGpp synthetase/guanosine-3',5'-bis(diphosphate) 3'-pyrophosphohydrolase [Bacteroidetes bacterium]|nr:bifunctional (p)ppGpp synthetase/guanosine-3',5'-bis(diphosphate) 3'-pyrophosphohydrolase [Bacteroidota bacterium]
MTDIQTLYQNAIKFAAERHGSQKVKGSRITYVVHLSNVAMELFVAARNTPGFDLSLAIQAALLHDTIEDTATTRQEIEATFGQDVADAVWALTKDKKLLEDYRLTDSLAKIRQCPKEVWAVKLADRITNLQKPPENWSKDHITEFHYDSVQILEALEGGNQYLEQRLKVKINEYKEYLQD